MIIENSTMNKPLSIYKASAGSGKTFTLAVEYIKLLIRDPKNYRHTLAVTFTNKATEEMKMRILAQLYGISKELTSSDAYVDKIAQETGNSKEDIRQKSTEALNLLLHDYEFFRIETIDSFFQRIFRNLAHELDLTPNLRIDLNDSKVLEEAVDCIVKESATNSKTRGLLLRFIQEAIADDHSWNIIGGIKNFGKNIFRDFYKDNRKGINQAILQIKEVEQNLKKTIAEFEKTMDGFVKEYESKGLPSNRNIDSYFNKLRNHRYSAKDNLHNKTVENHPELCGESEDYRIAHSEEYFTAKVALKNLAQLELLQEIGKKVNELNTEADRFLLSDTQNILSTMIGSDSNDKELNAPFIYEKIGSRLRHIMIDEFQDTSVKQWRNFQVLLDECISHTGNTSLIVGDIKQSIYRWRSGDWRLLHELGDEDSQSYRGMVTVKPLDTNYRSSKTVVDFNNEIFKTIIEKESYGAGDYAAQLKSAYSDIEQKTKQDAGEGYVKIDFLDSEDYEKKTMDGIYDTIVELKNKGYNENDIAILLRNNDAIAKIADYFTQCHSDITIISDEAFKLSASKGVNLIIEAMKYVVQNDDISLANLAKIYQKDVLGKDIDETSLFLNKSQTTAFLPEGFAERIASLKEMPVYELAEEIFQMFDIERMIDEGGYICSFFDVVLNYIKSGASSIKRFIADWDTDLHKQTIQSDSFNGVRIMTIHKSKGLEFANVIIPFCDWKIEKAGGTIWVSTNNNSMFCGIPVVPVTYSQLLKESNFKHAYDEEHFQNIIDNINLLYVAFTRARKNLFVISKSKSATDMISKFINNATENSEYMHGNTYERGALTEPKKESKVEDNLFNQQVTGSIPVTISSSDHAINFNQSNESNIFVNGENDSNDINRERGILLHNIFSAITTVSDAPKVLDNFESQGLLSSELLTRQEAQEYIDRCFTNETMRDWFSDKWHICNERDIVAKNSLRRRCDRIIFNDNSTIVLDFKFGKAEEKYKYQVKNYMSLLTQIGFNNVRGFLWYAEDNILEEVK
ncbi:MAG: UvrD-helicase domain-containing protein [Prevotellaceae bacterium]|nr:UvrD-helicase domain-containing protein [Prevotellaceae bacterium]